MMYDLNIGQWSQVDVYVPEIDPSKGFRSLVPEPRFYHSMDLYYNRLVMFGGGGEYMKSVKGRKTYNDIWFFDILSCKWTNTEHTKSLTSDYAPCSRMYHAASIYNNGKFLTDLT